MVASGQLPRLQNEGALVKIDKRSGMLTKIADIEAFAIANPPASPHPSESNPFGLARTLEGKLNVADAGQTHCFGYIQTQGRSSSSHVSALYPVLFRGRIGAISCSPIRYPPM